MQSSDERLRDSEGSSFLPEYGGSRAMDTAARDASSLRQRASSRNNDVPYHAGHIDDLGLSTHRPVSAVDLSERSIQKEFYQPVDSRPRAGQVFSEKTTEEIRTALGEEAFENLMNTVNRNCFRSNREISGSEKVHESQPQPGATRTASPPTPSKSGYWPMYSSSAQSGETVLRDISDLKEGEREVLTLIRNYDQVTVPKNTRNSFSADEIYRQAFGNGATNDSVPLKQTNSGQPWQPSVNKSIEENDNVSYHGFQTRPSDVQPHPRYSHHGAASSPPSYTGRHPSSHAYLSSNYSSTPPQVAFPQSPTFYNAERGNRFFPETTGFNMYRNPANQAPPQFHENQVHYSQNGPHFSPYNSLSHPGPGFFSYPPPPPPPYPNPHVLKFPENGVPLHLPPPPIPSASYHQQGNPWPQSRHQSMVAPTSARRNSLSHVTHGNSYNEPMGYMMPHPPSHPPALRPREGRSTNVPSSTHKFESNGEHNDPSHLNNYSLHRYFSSLELSNLEPSHPSHPQASSAPSSSRSAVEESHNALDDCDSTVVSRATRHSTVSSASGVTDRLKDLGVDLDHLKLLKVVERNLSHESDDAAFETLSRGIRKCPECGSRNKAYMDWCTECGEILIGIEPTLPNSKKKPEEKRKRVQLGKEGMRKDKSHERLRDSRSSDILEVKSVRDSFPPKESPESGKGLSVSNSPVRYWRDTEEPPEAKDSGRASSLDQRDQPPHLQGDANVDVSEEELVEESAGEEFECEAESADQNLCDQISDPVLREFILSYRRRQGNMAQGFEDGRETFQPNNRDVKHEREVVADTASFNVPADSQGVSDVRPKTGDNMLKKRDGAVPREPIVTNSWCEGMADDAATNKDARPKRKTSKKKKRTTEMMDIEIFGYEEIRQSRQSYQEINTNVVPALNLANSSEEDDTSGSESDGEEESLDIGAPGVLSEEDSDYDVAEQSVEVHDARSVPQAQPEIRENVALSTSESPVETKTDHRGAYSAVRPKNSKVSNQSAVRLSNGRGPNTTDSSAAGQRRHWEKSNLAWSSFAPRELKTRSSLTITKERKQKAPSPQRKDSEEVMREDGQQQGAMRKPQSPASGIPVRQRPTSAGTMGRTSAQRNEARPRPSSATVRPGSRATQESRSSPNLGQRTNALTRQRNSVARSSTGESQSSRGVASSAVYGAQSGGVGLRTSHSSSNLSISEDRPSSTDSESRQTKKGVEQTDVSPRFLCNDIHRLPNWNAEENHAEKLHAVAQSSYDKLQEMTPRIAEGVLSMWQCLPDEIWLFIFGFLSQSDLKNAMLTCHFFHRLANDETLWRYITVKPRFQMTDGALAAIAHHRPVSVALLKCQGQYVTQQGLANFFQETQEKLKELNICGCSQGCMVGSVVLEEASRHCQLLTHLDASFCNISNESFLALSHCAHRLESVCLNGFQRMSDSTLIEFLKKHGKSLHTLELYACFGLSASALRSVGEQCTSLKRLCLGSCNKLTDSTMITMSTHLARIEELDLRGCKNLRNDCVRKIVKNCPRIHSLVLANCQQISDIALTEIATYLKSTLRSLDVCGCNQVSDVGVVGLAKNCDLLNCLDISSTRCTSASVTQLASNNCSQWLHTVKLSFLSSIPEACIQNLIKHCPRLKLVHVFGCSSLKNLNKLRAFKNTLQLEGDSDGPRFSMS